MFGGNPALNENVFNRIGGGEQAAVEKPANVMTVNGAVHKTAILTVLLLTAAGFTWKMYFNANPSGTTTPTFGSVMPWVVGGGIGGLIIGIITCMNPKASPITGPLYALCEGLLLGGISAIFESFYEGIVMQAVTLTIGILFGMLILYRARIIRATEKFKACVFAGVVGVVLFYFITWILRMVGVDLGLIYDGGPIAIGISLVIVGLASLMLIISFDFIEQGAREGAPKYMEWYAAFGLMVTLVWLYLEVLRLLSYFAGDD